MRRIKEYVFPCVTFAATTYFFSVMFSIGMMIGYLGTVLFHRKLVHTGKVVDQVNFRLGRYRFHLHHWLMGAVLLLVIWLTGLSHFIPEFGLGAISGMIFHDFYEYDDWYEIISRK